MSATQQQLEFLQIINAEVNAIPYEALGKDAEYDNWIDAPEPGQVWECRDYTIAKAKLMREQGWPFADMGVVICNTEVFADPSFPDRPPSRYLHAVQYARAGGEVWILDNRFPTIYRWDKAPYDYQWLHQQTHDTPGELTWRDASNGLQ